VETTTPTPKINDLSAGTHLSSSDNLIANTLIDTEAFASYFKNVSQKNEKIISEFTNVTIYNPISDRISTEVDGTRYGTRPGFDAAVAATLGLVPTKYLAKIMELHNGQYTPDSIAEMKTHINSIRKTSENQDSYTMWWLAYSSICYEGNTTSVDFYQQYQKAIVLFQDYKARYSAAHTQAIKLLESFTVSENMNGIPYGTIDGALHGAYLAGHEVASLYAKEYGIYFLGTYIEGKFDNIVNNHKFSTELDSSGRTKSGVVNPTFLKFGTQEEMKAATGLL
jgi:hypothetical protein